MNIISANILSINTKVFFNRLTVFEYSSRGSDRTKEKICELFTFSVPSTRTGNCCSTCAKFHFRCNRVPWWKRREYFFAVVCAYVDIRCQYIEDVFLHFSFYFFAMEKRKLKRVFIMVFVVTKERNEIWEKRGNLKSTCYCSSSSVVNGKVFVVFTDCNF